MKAIYENTNSKYSQELVDCIIDDLLSKQLTQSQIREKYGVTQQLVTSINRGVTHRREGVNYPILVGSLYNCNMSQIEAIRYLLANSKCTCAEIAEYFNFSTSAVKRINTGHSHFDPAIQYPIRNFRGKAKTQSVEAILVKRSTETIDTSLEM